jgi:hypothetical protein
MIVQIVIPSSGSVSSILPITGKCKIKLIKIDYLHNTAAAVIPYICRLESNELFNNTPQLSGRIFFLNSSQAFWGSSFIVYSDIPQQVNISVRLSDGSAIPTTAGGLSSLLLTLDIEEINKYIQ